MRHLAVVANVVLFLFTGMAMATDGVSAEPAYIAFTVLMVLTPVATILAFVGSARWWPRRREVVERGVAIANVVLLASLGCAFVDQYPHPDESGFVAFVVVAAATPLLSAVVLFFGVRMAPARSA